MPDGTVGGIKPMALYELLGAALVAILQAESQAAKATLEFIETVGFVSGAPPATGATKPEETKTAIGQLRMAEFRYSKLDENRQISEFVASVPILSLVPIPAIQIKEAKIAFAARIVDNPLEATPTGNPGPETLPKPIARLVSWLRPKPRELVTTPVPTSGPKDKEERGTYHLDINITLGQADMPGGMERIFNLMDQAMQEAKAPKST